MKSPFTGGSATLKAQADELTYRKEKYPFVHLYYECDDTREHFTVDELDDLNLAQVYNRYRVKYGIPFPDEIRDIRLRYGLSAAKMSDILGLGDNQYRLYENGDMPSETNGKLLASIRNASVFEVFVNNARNQLGDKEYKTIMKHLEESEDSSEAGVIQGLVYSGYGRCEMNGFAPQSLKRLKAMLLYFIYNNDSAVFNTKMNKLLFYADFLSYRERAMSISGLVYKAIQYGPVPLRWDRIYGLIDGVEQAVAVTNGVVVGQQLISLEKPDLQVFSDAELRILDAVQTKFKNCNSAELSSISHEELAWQHCIGKDDSILSYDDAFSLKGI